MITCFTIQPEEKGNGLCVIDGIDVIRDKREGHEQHCFVALGGKNQLANRTQVHVAVGIRDMDIVDDDNKIVENCSVRWGGKPDKRIRPFVSFSDETDHRLVLVKSPLPLQTNGIDTPIDIYSNIRNSKSIVAASTADSKLGIDFPAIHVLLSIKGDQAIWLTQKDENGNSTNFLCFQLVSDGIVLKKMKAVPSSAVKLYTNSENDVHFLNMDPKYREVHHNTD